MSNNPINLALRFLLEIAAVLAIAYWGWEQGAGPVRYVLALTLALAAAAAWGTFRVPGDVSASGGAPVPVPGPIRLLIELALFGSAVWGLFSQDAATLGLVLGGVAVLHYLISYDRVFWLLSQ
jgi:hypothetical protein